MANIARFRVCEQPLRMASLTHLEEQEESYARSSLNVRRRPIRLDVYTICLDMLNNQLAAKKKQRPKGR